MSPYLAIALPHIKHFAMRMLTHKLSEETREETQARMLNTPLDQPLLKPLEPSNKKKASSGSIITIIILSLVTYFADEGKISENQETLIKTIIQSEELQNRIEDLTNDDSKNTND